MATKESQAEALEDRFELSNPDFVDLPQEEREQLIEYNQSIKGIEKARGLRILFDQAPSETLPFIIYSMYVSANAFGAIALMITVTGFLWQISLLIALAMILPLVALPPGSFSDTYEWVRKFLSFQRS